MDKKLEARVARLERLLSRKNEDSTDAIKAQIINAFKQIDQAMSFLDSNKVIQYLNIVGSDPENDYDDYADHLGSITVSLEMIRDMLGMGPDDYFFGGE